jgi:ribosome-associated protein
MYKLDESEIRKINEIIKIESTGSSKPGGQHMQKTETKIRARIYIDDLIKTLDLDREQIKKLKKEFKEGFIEAISEDTRFKILNKKFAIERLIEKLEKALYMPEERIIVYREPKAAKDKRIKEKKITSEKKKLRRKLKGY